MEIPRRTVWGYSIMLLCVGGFVLSIASVQLLHRKIPDFQLAVLRYLGIFILTSIPLIATRTNPKVAKESWMYVLLMGFITNGLNIFFYYAASLVPLSHMSFMNIFKLIVMMVTSRLLLHEPHSIIISVSIVGCTFGSLFLIQPWSGFTEGFTATLINSTMESTATINTSAAINDFLPTYEGSSGGISHITLAYIALILAGCCEVFFILVGGVYLQKEKPTVLIWLASALAIPVSLLLCLYTEQPVWIPDLYTMVLVALHAVGSGVGLLCMVIACNYITPVQVTIIVTLENIFQLVLQYTLFSTTLYGHRNVLEVLGCLLITVSVIFSAVFNNVNKHEDF